MFCGWSQITETQQGRTSIRVVHQAVARACRAGRAHRQLRRGRADRQPAWGLARADGDPREQQLPIIWNSGLLSPQSYELLAPLVQTWIIDLKLSDDRWLGAGTLPYLDEVSRWLDRLHQDVTAQKDRLIIRHLVMPGQVESQTLPLLKRCAQRWPKATVNLMTQYLPFGPAMRAKDRSHPLRKIANTDEIALAREALQAHPGPALVDGEIHSHRIDT